MLRLGLQLEMGMFAATICGLVGVAFGMNLDSSLEDVGNRGNIGCGFTQWTSRIPCIVPYLLNL